MEKLPESTPESLLKTVREVSLGAREYIEQRGVKGYDDRKSQLGLRISVIKTYATDLNPDGLKNLLGEEKFNLLVERVTNLVEDYKEFSRNFSQKIPYTKEGGSVKNKILIDMTDEEIAPFYEKLEHLMDGID